jgi:hypothetical protein
MDAENENPDKIYSACDLPGFVIADDGVFSSRDAIFDRYGLFLHQPGEWLFALISGGHKAAC